MSSQDSSPLAQLSQLESELLPLLSPPNSPPSTRIHSPLPSCSPPRKPRVTRYWLAACLVVVLLQTILIIRHTDIMAPFIDIESATRRALSEASTLAVEKEKTEHEREAMAREEELWEKAKEKRVPQGAFWDTVWPAWDCRAYGKREYWGALRNIPEGWSDIDACMNMPVEIKGVTVRRPYRCAYVQGSPHIHGYWMVDWNQADCKPWYRYPDFQDKGCTSSRSGERRYEVPILGINDKGGQDWRLLCNTIPLVWDLITYPSPTHCEERFMGWKIAMWDIPDESCL